MRVLVSFVLVAILGVATAEAQVGGIVAWGDNSYGQCDVPSPNANFVSVAAGNWFSVGLKAGGSIVAWGHNEYGQCNVPSPNAAFVAIAAGAHHVLGLKSDGTIVTWG
jgi:alpha-tubulin suppressor-like RCC1 family protein